jgi:hypothetical protein
MLHMSAKGRAFVRAQKGCRLEAYRDRHDRHLDARSRLGIGASSVVRVPTLNAEEHPACQAASLLKRAANRNRSAGRKLLCSTSLGSRPFYSGLNVSNPQ